MTTAISLKELTGKYTITDIIREANMKYTLFAEDFASLSDLVAKIRNSPDEENNETDIVLMVAFPKKGEKPALISYAGFEKNGRHCKFTAKDHTNIDRLSCCHVRPIKKAGLSAVPFASEYLPQTELEVLITILLSINAFSREVIDCYFEGEAKNADSISYILRLIENNDSPVNNF